MVAGSGAYWCGLRLCWSACQSSQSSASASTSAPIQQTAPLLERVAVLAWMTCPLPFAPHGDQNECRSTHHWKWRRARHGRPGRWSGKCSHVITIRAHPSYPRPPVFYSGYPMRSPPAWDIPDITQTSAPIRRIRANPCSLLAIRCEARLHGSERYNSRSSRCPPQPAHARRWGDGARLKEAQGSVTLFIVKFNARSAIRQ